MVSHILKAFMVSLFKEILKNYVVLKGHRRDNKFTGTDGITKCSDPRFGGTPGFSPLMMETGGINVVGNTKKNVVLCKNVSKMVGLLMVKQLVQVLHLPLIKNVVLKEKN